MIIQIACFSSKAEIQLEFFIAQRFQSVRILYYFCRVISSKCILHIHIVEFFSRVKFSFKSCQLALFSIFSYPQYLTISDFVPILMQISLFHR